MALAGELQLRFRSIGTWTDDQDTYQTLARAGSDPKWLGKVMPRTTTVGPPPDDHDTGGSPVRVTVPAGAAGWRYERSHDHLAFDASYCPCRRGTGCPCRPGARDRRRHHRFQTVVGGPSAGAAAGRNRAAGTDRTPGSPTASDDRLQPLEVPAPDHPDRALRHPRGVLERDGTDVLRDDQCRAVSGRWLSAYDGRELTAASQVDIDHIVPLANAWRSGADTWTTDKRKAFANDLTNPQLIAVSAASNRAKGDQSPDQWAPPLRSYWCTYSRAWTHIKAFYALTVTDAEKSRLAEMLDTCTP